MAAGQTSAPGVACTNMATLCLKRASSLGILASIFKTSPEMDAIFSYGDTPDESWLWCRSAIFHVRRNVGHKDFLKESTWLPKLYRRRVVGVRSLSSEADALHFEALPADFNQGGGDACQAYFGH